MTWPPKPKPKAQPRAKRVVTQPEEALQRSVVKFLHLALPVGCGVEWSATLNGIRVSSSIRAKLKDLGTNPGVVLDLCFIDRRPDGPLFGHTRWIELKSAKGVPSSDMQRKVMTALIEAGTGCYARSLEEVEAALRGWGFPLQASLS